MRSTTTRPKNRQLQVNGNRETLPAFPLSEKQKTQMWAGLIKARKSKEQWFTVGRKAKADSDHAAIAAARPLKPPGRK